MTTLWPVFPEEIGSSVEFEKDGAKYRMLKSDTDTWVIHKAGASREQFELFITNRKGGLMDVFGRGHVGQVDALGVSEGITFDKLF